MNLIEGYKYFLTIVEDCTCVTWIYMLRNKYDVSTVFHVFIQHVKTQYHSEITIIPTDDAPELIFATIFKKSWFSSLIPLCLYASRELYC